jgi:hypothetical protein
MFSEDVVSKNKRRHTVKTAAMSGSRSGIRGSLPCHVVPYAAHREVSGGDMDHLGAVEGGHGQCQNW